MHRPLVSLSLGLAACVGDGQNHPNDPHTGTSASDDLAWWFQIVGAGGVVLMDTCDVADPATFAARTAIVGWFDRTATFGLDQGAETTLTADGIDGFAAVLDAEGSLVRVVQFGGPGDQRAAACGGPDLFVAGSFGGSMSASGTTDALVAATTSDVFAYREWPLAYGAPDQPSLEHVVEGSTVDLFVSCTMFGCGVGGSFEGAITVWPRTAQSWSATSAGGLDGFYARPSTPLLVAGPGRDALRAATPWTGMAGPGIPRVDVTWLAGSASDGAVVVAGAVTTEIPAGFGGADALLLHYNGWLEDAEGLASAAVRGGAGDDALHVVAYPNELFLVGAFHGGDPGASVPWGGRELTAHGGDDVFVSRENGWGDGDVVDVLAVGSPGDDTLLHAHIATGYGAGGSSWVEGGLATGQFAEGAFAAPGLAPVASCGAATTWVLTFGYQNRFVPTWLGSGCGLTVVDARVELDGSAWVAANHGANATLDLPTRTVTPPAPPPGGSGAFVASWNADRD